MVETLESDVMRGKRQRLEDQLAEHCGDFVDLPPGEKEGLIREIFTGRTIWRHYLKPQMLLSGCAVILLLLVIIGMRPYVNAGSVREFLLSLPFVAVALVAAFVSRWLVLQLMTGMRDGYAHSIVAAFGTRNMVCSFDSASAIAQDLTGGLPGRVRWRDVPIVVAMVFLVLFI